jgi:hypothetical protein
VIIDRLCVVNAALTIAFALVALWAGANGDGLITCLACVGALVFAGMTVTGEAL